MQAQEQARKPRIVLLRPECPELGLKSSMTTERGVPEGATHYKWGYFSGDELHLHYPQPMHRAARFPDPVHADHECGFVVFFFFKE